MSDRIVMIVNPASGNARSGPFVAALRLRLLPLDARLTVHHTTGPGDAGRAAAALDPDVGLIVVVGGDGTVNEVVDGLIGRPVPVLVVPWGTENILARSLGLRASLDAIERTARGGRVIPFDVAVAETRRFLCVAGIGFDAEVVRRLVARRAGHITHLSYLWPIWRTFWEWTFPPLAVVADGSTLYEGPGLAFVGNVPRYAIGLRILRDARPDDGLLDVCVYPCRGQGTLLLHSLRTLLRRHVDRGGVIYRRAGRVVVRATRPLPVEVDGELFRSTPVQFSILPAAARFVVPPEAR